MVRSSLSLILALACVLPQFAPAQHYIAPAGERSAVKRLGAESILPGGRLITPLGRQFSTGPAPFGLSVSPNGSRVATADGGRDRSSVTVLSEAGNTMRRARFAAPREGSRESRQDDWRGVYLGIAFDGNGRLYVSEGQSGRVRLMSATSGTKIRSYQLNQQGFRDSISAGLALDAKRRRLYVVDQANFRLAVLDTRNGQVVQSIPVGRLPLHVALSPDKLFAYVTNQGMFRYAPIAGGQARSGDREAGLPFPAFGFPSKEAEQGGLGDPNAPESNSVSVIDLTNPAEGRVTHTIRTGLPFGAESKGGSHPSGLLATARHLFVSNGHNDSITVIDRTTHGVLGEIGLRITGLETLRGVMPTGLAMDPQSGLLYVAEAGINAVAVVDPARREVLGHLPVGWFPSALEVREGTLYVANAKGHGTGPNAGREAPHPRDVPSENQHGTVSVFPIPGRQELAAHTARVLANNGFQPVAESPGAISQDLKYVVLISKGNSTYDEVFGDIQRAANGPVKGAASLARHGNLGYAEAERSGLVSRGEFRDTAITPNQHALASRFAFSDNFYSGAELSVLGQRWAAGVYPNSFSELLWPQASPASVSSEAPGRLFLSASRTGLLPEEQPEAGSLWHHLETHGIPFRNFGVGLPLPGAQLTAGLKPTGARYLWNVPLASPLYRHTSREYPGYNTNLPDQYRASQFIREMDTLYRNTGQEPPRLLFLSLPNNDTDRPRPEDGYPFRASYVADNDIALGRIVEYLSRTPWWKHIAIFVAETGTEGGADHVDSHRSGLLVISPYARRNYASHRNTGMPGVLKTTFRILGVPPLNLYDATTADLSDCFTTEPDFSPYTVLPVKKEIFDPERAKDPLDPEPSTTN